MNLKANIAQVQQRINHALKASDKGQDGVTLVAVTKSVDVDTIKAVIAEGIEIIGENRIQIAKTKYQEIGNRVRWHMIGHLQQNKVRDAVQMFELIHSVDSCYLAEAINEEADRQNKIQDVLIQVNTSGEKTKYGLSLTEADALVRKMNEFPHLNIKGLMTIGPLSDEPGVLPLRSCFQQLFHLYHHLKTDGFSLQYLSMGMSDDFELAISEGSNMVRIGQAIFAEAVSS
ncbi:MAG: YggS family pyridoxal phosphate-dependent enzyme [bacterium]|nr:YggS family pyridoxal phosphate-dependent enzyme [bacterium]